MKKLFLKSLTIISHVERSANQFLFQNWNLILSDYNGDGKTTLIDMIFWTLGYDVELKNNWQKAAPCSLIEIEIDGEGHIFGRCEESFFYKKSIEYSFNKYTNITGDFSKKVLEIFGLIELQVFDRSKKLISPTPSYVLSPFYIEQDSWNSDIYSNIIHKMLSKSSYDTILKFLIGHIDGSFFRNQLDIENSKTEIKNFETEKETLSTAKLTIRKLLNVDSDNRDYLISLLYDKENNLAEHTERKISKLLKQKHSLVDNLNALQNDNIFYKNQLKIVKSAYVERERDYTESVEYQESVITCPICGVNHDNSIELRTQLLTDKSEAERSYSVLNNTVNEITIKIKEIREKLHSIDFEIDIINDSLSSKNTVFEERYSIEDLVSMSIENKIENQSESLDKNIKEENRTLRALRKTTKEITDKDNIIIIDTYFQDKLSKFINALSVIDSNFEEVSTPLKYASFSCGKGAESSRAVLALYLSIWSTMERNHSCFFPLFIDTPNQHEQDNTNYPKTVKAIVDNIPTHSQLFVCALDREELEALKDKSFVIKLSSSILCKEKYEKLKELFDFE